MVRLQLAKEPKDFPQLVSFPMGVPEDVETMELKVEDKGSSKKRKRRLVGEINDVHYEGRDYDDDASKNNLLSYAIGYLDEGNNTMTIYPADHIFVMRPRFPEKEKTQSRLSTMSYAERKHSLTAEFGSKKKQRALRAAESNTILAENVSGAATVNNLVISNIEKSYDNELENIASATEKALDQNRANMLPPYNEQATEVDKIYPLESLFSISLQNELEGYYTEYINTCMNDPHSVTIQNVYETLHPTSLSKCTNDTRTYMRAALNYAEKYLNQSTLNSINYCMSSFINYIQSFISKTKLGNKHKENIEKRFNILYLLSLCIIVYTAFEKESFIPADNLKEKLGTETSDSLFKYIVEHYSRYTKQKGVPTYATTRPYKNKLILYIIILALTINEYSVNLNELAKALNIQVARLANFAKETGCQILKQKDVTSNEEIMIAQLVVPLTFPTVKAPIRAKKAN